MGKADMIKLQCNVYQNLDASQQSFKLENFIGMTQWY